VTLSNGQQTHVVEASSSSLKATPLALAWVPHMLVAADSNKDQHLNLAEFTEQLKRVGTAAEEAKKLFAAFDTTKDNNLSVDEYYKGIKASLAGGDTTFTLLVETYQRNAAGEVDMQALTAFLQQGQQLAEQYAHQSDEYGRR